VAEPLYTPVPIHKNILDWIVSTDRDLFGVDPLAPLIPAHEES
jgi:hypothetical protein